MQKKIIYLIFIIFFSFLCAEIFLRIPFIHDKAFPVYGGLFEITKGSFKDIDENKDYIIGIGDSFLAAYKPNVLESAIKIINEEKPAYLYPLVVAHAGRGPLEYIEKVNEALEHVKAPKAIVLFYDSFTDLFDVVTSERLVRFAKKYRIKANKHKKPNLKSAIFEHSMAYCFIRRLYRGYIAPRKDNLMQYCLNLAAACNTSKEKAAESFKSLDPVVLRKALREQINPNDVARFTACPDSATWGIDLSLQIAQDAWKKTEIILSLIKHKAESAGAKFFIVQIPNSMQVSKKHVKFYRSMGAIIPTPLLESTVIQDNMREFCRKNDIVYIDLLPFFKDNSGTELYLEGDMHWNKIGRKMAAEYIAPIIAKNIERIR